MNTGTSEPQYLIAFMPWLTLKQECEVAGVRFVPFRDRDGRVSPLLGGAERQIALILSSYVDAEGQSVATGTIATTPGRGWNLADGDFDLVDWAASLLFIASWATNEYFPKFFGAYVNASYFRVVWQRFTGDATWIAPVSRRRDGSMTNGGYEHGKIRFSRPMHCATQDPADIDVGLLEALDKASAQGSETIQRLRSAASFVELANTDDELVNWKAEAILMACAFEQMLDADGSKRELVTEFAPLFAPFGALSVDDTLKVRPDIWLDPQYAQAQRGWWVHKKWIEELYNLRSKSAHKGTHAGRNWAWLPREHLVMAAFVFPLLIKLMLAREGFYELSDEDRAHGGAVDRILASTGWHEPGENRPNPDNKWNKAIRDAAEPIRLQRIIEAYKAASAAAQSPPE